MANCPFCEGEIEDTLAQFGGPCPRCFADIPGEDAPTDPGEEKKAILRRREQRRAVLSAVIPLVLAVPLVTAGLLLVLILTLRPFDPKVADALDFDDDEYYMPVFVGAAAEATPSLVMVQPDAGDREAAAAVAVAANTPANPAPNNDGVADAADVEAPAENPREPAYNPSEAPDGADKARERLMNNPLFSGGAGDLGTDDPFANLATNDRDYKEEGGLRSVNNYGAADIDIATPDLDRPRSITPPPTTAANLGGPIGGGTVTREKGRIERSDEVKDHIWSVMKNSLPTLQYCYEMRLKEDENLQGKWRLDFVVTTEGTVKDVAATGLNMQDTQLEDCMIRKIQKWSFFKLPADQPVGKSITFRPGWG